VEIVVHRQSIVHSLVEYVDGSVLAQLGSPDMRTPIAQALAWPSRVASGATFLDLVRVGRLDFCAPDARRFGCLPLAQAAARAGGLVPAILNAANEIAVEAFLARRLNFLEIPKVIEAVLCTMKGGPVRDLDDVLSADAESRRLAHEYIVSHARSACA
jgi:1-deoxy-D-xylulose-5-phosphate reductoisomerase